MKTLTLLRHAKSGYDDPLLRDFDRPLNDRGRRAAMKVGCTPVSKDSRVIPAARAVAS